MGRNGKRVSTGCVGGGGGREWENEGRGRREDRRVKEERS